MPQSSANRTKRAVAIAATLCFLAFTVWIIHEANIGRDNALFVLVRKTPYGDKIGHFFLAGLLTLAANFVLRNRSWQLGYLRLPIGSLVVLGLAVLEESSQHFLAYRSLDLADAIANLAGIATFSIPALVSRSRRAEISRNRR